MKHRAIILLSVLAAAQVSAGEPPAPNPRNSFEQILMRVTPEMESKIHDRFRKPRQIHDEDTMLDPRISDDLLRLRRLGYVAGTYPVRWDPFINRWEVTYGPEYERCLIAPLHALQTAPEHHKEATIAHELYHCYQIEKIAGELPILPRWLVEGSAMWVGESFVTGGTELSHSHWTDYLGTARDLVSRDYDAFGLFWYLDNSGVDNYELVKRLLLKPNSEEMWAELEAYVPTEKRAGWAPGLLQDATVSGPLWNFRAPQIPAGAVGTYPRSPVFVPALPATYDVSVSRTPRLFQLVIPQDKTVKFRFTAVLGAVRVMHAGREEVNELITENGQGIKLCYGTDCTCPGHQPSIDTTEISNPLVEIAVYSPDGSGEIVLEEEDFRCCDHPLGENMQHLIGTWHVDQGQFLQSRYPSRNVAKTHVGIRGDHTMTISESGLVVKQYDGLAWWLSWDAPKDWREDHHIDGTFRACLSVRLHAQLPDQGDVYHATLSQYSAGLSYAMRNSSGAADSKDIEPFFLNWGHYESGDTEELFDVFTLEDGVLKWRSSYRK